MLEFAWIVIGPKLEIGIRKDGKSEAIMAPGKDLPTVLNMMVTAGWKVSPGHDDHEAAYQMLSGEAVEIELQRPLFYDDPMTTTPLRYSSCRLDGSESEEVVKKRFEVNGWDVVKTLRTINDGTHLIVSKPYAAPDLPFK